MLPLVEERASTAPEIAKLVPPGWSAGMAERPK
jgi:hypothetical protein